MDSSAKHPGPKISAVGQRVGVMVANVCSVLLLLTMGYAWIRERRTFYLVVALLAAFNLVIVVGEKLHARRKRNR